MPDIKPELRSYENHGFQFTFANGWTISVMFGPGTYSSNRSAKDLGGTEWKATSADVSVWDVDGNDLRFSANISQGWVTPDKTAKLIAFVQGLSKDLGASAFELGVWRNKLVALLAEDE